MVKTKDIVLSTRRTDPILGPPPCMVYVRVCLGQRKRRFHDYRFKWYKEYSLDYVCQPHIDRVK
jgi:hypothetical protein